MPDLPPYVEAKDFFRGPGARVGGQLVEGRRPLDSRLQQAATYLEQFVGVTFSDLPTQAPQGP